MFGFGKFSRWALCALAVGLLLIAGCGEAQPPLDDEQPEHVTENEELEPPSDEKLAEMEQALKNTSPKPVPGWDYARCANACYNIFIRNSQGLETLSSWEMYGYYLRCLYNCGRKYPSDGLIMQ